MKKMKLFVCLIAIAALIPPLTAGPNCCPGRPCCHRHHGRHGSSGVRLAADIVNLVGASLNLLHQPVAVPAAVPVIARPVCQPGYPVPVPCRRPCPPPCRPCRPCPCR